MGNDGSKDSKPDKTPTPPSSQDDLHPLNAPSEEADPEFLEQLSSDLVADTTDALKLLGEQKYTREEDEEEEGISLADINQEEPPKEDK